MVNSSQGGGSKDTWVLASRTSAADRELGAAEVVKKLPKSVTTNGESDGAKPQSQKQSQKQFQQQRQPKSQSARQQQPGQQQQLQAVIR